MTFNLLFTLNGRVSDRFGIINLMLVYGLMSHLPRLLEFDQNPEWETQTIFKLIGLPAFLLLRLNGTVRAGNFQ